MKYRFFILITALITLLIVFGYFCLDNELLKEKSFTKMTIYMNGNGPYIITDQKVISNFISKLNSSPKEEKSKIIFEKGPDGRIIFEGKNTFYEVKVFSLDGNVVTDKYLINTGINLNKIIVNNSQRE